jgi:hypothetical protein
VREGNQKRAGGRSQALCAITESQIIVVGVAQAAAALGLAADFNRLSVSTPPLVLERAAVEVEVSKRILTRRLTVTDRATGRRYEFEVHTAGTGDFNDQFFSALRSDRPT